jgi:hypothetical protein
MTQYSLNQLIQQPRNGQLLLAHCEPGEKKAIHSIDQIC